MERLGWCLEFVLGHSSTSIESEHIKEILKLSSSVTEIDNRKMKMLLLEGLEDELLSKASIDEWMLELLEVFEKLLLIDWDPSSNPSNPSSNPNPPISDAMKSAYVYIAVECTVRYLEAAGAGGISNPKHYLQAVDRIWNRRFQNLEGRSYLLTPKLRFWKSRIDASLFNSRYMLKLASLSDTRRKAIQEVQLFLEDARNNLVGPSFLHSVAAPSAAQNQSHNESPMELDKDNGRLKGKASTTVVVVEVMATSTSCSKIDSLPVNEAQKNGDSLKCNSVEFKTFANDPVPNSICMPDIVRSDVAIEDTNQEPQMENQSKDANVPNPHACLNVNNDEANLTKATSHQSDVHHPSLMKPNSSARTHEWDDSIDGLQAGTSRGTSRIRLRSPERKKLSPLKEYEPKNITKRRKKKKWSQWEEDNLRTGIKLIGEGNWKSILRSYEFDERTEVDLKDKWRNLKRSGCQ